MEEEMHGDGYGLQDVLADRLWAIAEWFWRASVRAHRRPLLRGWLQERGCAPKSNEPLWEETMMDEEFEALMRGFVLGSLLGGLAAGAAALLFAPHSGKTTRRLIRAKGEVTRSKLESRMAESLWGAE
jgi:hypothetical protein